MSLIGTLITFVAATKAKAAEVNSNFSAIKAVVNGNIDDENVAADAGIKEAKSEFHDTAGHIHSGENNEGTKIPTSSIKDLTATAKELNKLHGTSSKITPGNLNTLVAGSGSNADSLHQHSLFTNPDYDSGWFAVAVNTDYAKSHGLGVFPRIVIGVLADDTDGLNSRVIPFGDTTWNLVPGAVQYTGVQLHAISATIITATTAQHRLYLDLKAGTSITVGYLKILAWL